MVFIAAYPELVYSVTVEPTIMDSQSLEYDVTRSFHVSTARVRVRRTHFDPAFSKVRFVGSSNKVTGA